MRPSDITDGSSAGRFRCSRLATRRFNEAVGYYRRKLLDVARFMSLLDEVASMRPSDITDGSKRRRRELRNGTVVASMRPSDITDGSVERHAAHRYGQPAASMRPSDITDGSRRASRPSSHGCHRRSFNEAVGYYRRKPPERRTLLSRALVDDASMRPSDITDGSFWGSLRCSAGVD